MSKRRKKKVKEPGTQDHHIFPSSLGGSSDPQNICRINGKKHEAYHYLFFNLSPDQIIIELVKKYWNGQTQWLEIALNELKGGE